MKRPAQEEEAIVERWHPCIGSTTISLGRTEQHKEFQSWWQPCGDIINRNDPDAMEPARTAWGYCWMQSDLQSADGWA